MSGLFKSKSTSPDVSVVSDPFASTRAKTTGWLDSQIGQPGPTYTGEQVAPMSGQEKSSLDWLQKYVDSGQGQGTQLANEEVRKTMAGEYDPTSSPYYQAVKAQAAQNLADTQENIAQNSAGGGRYWTGARLGAQGDAARDTGLSMNTLLYGMAENERNNRLKALPYAMQLGQNEEQAPLQKSTALQTLGALPRTLNQANLDAIKNEWVASNREWPLNIAQLSTPYASQQPTLAQTGQQESPFGSFISPILSSLIGSQGGNIADWVKNLFAKKSTNSGMGSGVTSTLQFPSMQ